MRRQELSRPWFVPLLAVLLGLIFCRYALQIPVPKVTFLVLLGMMAVFGGLRELLAVWILLIPLHESVDFYYSLVICLLAAVGKHYRKIRINRSVLLVLALVIWELLHCFRPDFSPMDMLISVLPLMTLAVMMAFDLEDLDYGFLVRCFAASTASIGITMLGQVLCWCDFSIPRAMTQLRRLGVVLESSGNSGITGGTIQTNSLGIICVLAVTGLLQLRSVKESRKGDTLLILLLLTLGTLTSSRTFLACLAVMVFLLILGQEGGMGKKLRFFGAMAVIAVLVLIFLQLCFPDLLSYYVSRFTERDITTGRDVLMAKYHDFLIRNPKVLLFGTGLQNFGHKLTVEHRIASNVPHNCIQEVLIAWGLPGLVLCGGLVLTVMGKSGDHNRGRKLLNYIPLLILLFKSLAGQLLTSGYSMLALSYCYLSLCRDFRPSEINRLFCGFPDVESAAE